MKKKTNKTKIQNRTNRKNMGLKKKEKRKD